jgi:hypothetical protein
MEEDLQSLLGPISRDVHTPQVYSLAEAPQLPPSPRIWTRIRGRYWLAKLDDIPLKSPVHKPCIFEAHWGGVTMYAPNN